MGFRCGIVGLPNVGKSTIFNALTKAGAASENYPFCTIEPNVGRVSVPDCRLQVLNSFINAQKVIPAVMEFVDIAGLVKGASKGEGLGNKFLSHIRETDAIAHVVRAFEDKDITHVDGSVDPIRDISTIETELIFADAETVDKAISRYQKLTKSGGKDNIETFEFLKSLASHLQELKPARDFSQDGLSENLSKVFYELHLITIKPVLYVCNVNEELASGKEDNEFTKAVKEHAKDAEVVLVSGKIEEELSELDDDERNEMIAELGMNEPGLNRLIRSGYKLLGLQNYFTAGEKEIRAWTIHKGDSAPVAAGKIHTDFERGFICAEVYTLPDIEEFKNKPALKEAGKIRTEGKEYIVDDGDVIEFRFNV